LEIFTIYNICKKNNISIIFDDFNILNKSQNGLLLLSSYKKIILVSRFLTLEEQKFTIAHEISHFILMHNTAYSSETEANILAGLLLLLLE